MNSLERLRSIETGLDISISTFPHQVELNRMRRRIAMHRNIQSFFHAAGDVVDNFNDLCARYAQYRDCWFELRDCIANDIRNRTDLFQQSIHGVSNHHRTHPIIQNGITQGVDANTSNIVLKTLRYIRPNFILRNQFLSERLMANAFYAHASENLKALITDFLFCTIVFPKPGGLVFSFHHPHQTQVSEGFRPGQQVVLFEEHYEDRAPHVTPLVPFVHYGGSFHVVDSFEYVMATPFPIHLPDISHVPLATPDHLTSTLHDHDVHFAINMTHVANDNVANVSDDFIQRAYGTITGGERHLNAFPVFFGNEFRLYLARRNDEPSLS